MQFVNEQTQTYLLWTVEWTMLGMGLYLLVNCLWVMYQGIDLAVSGKPLGFFGNMARQKAYDEYVNPPRLKDAIPFVSFWSIALC